MIRNNFLGLFWSLPLTLTSFGIEEINSQGFAIVGLSNSISVIEHHLHPALSPKHGSSIGYLFVRFQLFISS